MDTYQKSCNSKNPLINANFFSRLYCLWTWPTIVKGESCDLGTNDLFETLSEHKSELLGDTLMTEWEKELESANLKQRIPRLFNALYRTFSYDILILGIYAFIFDVIVITFSPICLGEIITYYETNNVVSKRELYFYTVGLIVSTLAYTLYIHPFIYFQFLNGMKIRIACCSVIYRKALKLNQSTFSKTTVGTVVNLLSNDVNCFDQSFMFFHYLWAGPLCSFICTILMAEEIGKSAIIGTIFIMSILPFQAWSAKKIAKIRLKTALCTDERVRIMNEIINGIQIIKMYTWEKPFTNLIKAVRLREMSEIKKKHLLGGITISMHLFNPKVALFLAIVSYLHFNDEISARKVFVLTAFYNIVAEMMGSFFPNAIIKLAEANTSMNRIEAFLLNEEVKPIQNSQFPSKNVVSGEDVEDENDKTEWVVFNQPSTNPFTQSCSTETNAVALTNASAKWILDDWKNTLDNLNIEFSKGTLNIIVGSVGSGKSSLLHLILKELSLSGGVLKINGSVSYASQKPWLFPGTIRQNILFGQEMDFSRYEEVVKCCALNQDLKLFPQKDETIVGERGISLSGGQRARINLARALYQDTDIYLLDDPLSAVDAHVGKMIFEECITKFLKNKTRILVTHQLQYLEQSDNIIVLSKGSVQAQGNLEELRQNSVNIVQCLDDNKHNDDIVDISDDTLQLKENNENLLKEETREMGQVKSYVYKSYFLNGGNRCFVSMVVLLLLLAPVFVTSALCYLTIWVNQQEHSRNTNDSSSFSNNSSLFIQIYVIITMLGIVATFARAYTFYVMCLRSSIQLHNKMFCSLIKATMHFFNTNLSGQILNRFSKDMGKMDEILPQDLMDCFQITGLTLCIIFVVIFANFWLIFPTVILVFIFYWMVTKYIRTSQNLIRLEALTRSPVFGHMNATLQGLVTIRACNTNAILAREFDNLQDKHTEAFFLYLAVSKGFGFILDSISLAYIIVVSISFLFMGQAAFGGDVGLALSQSIGLIKYLQYGILKATEANNSMVSIERILQYLNIEHEAKVQEKVPLEWPEKAQIEFKNLNLRYSRDEAPILKNVAFKIFSEEKIGVVGRTGAGKSSLIAALFRLAYLEGEILIDDINTEMIDLKILRSQISIIPQEPTLFSGTIRSNLDPFDNYSDSDIWKALEEVELKSIISANSEHLLAEISENGANFSVGQRQLICLARAILRRTKILILDEVTANIDSQTDLLIQRKIREKFSMCTVITIAHRLHTVIDSDRILVMDAGEVIEFDHPHVLLNNCNGYFYQLAFQTGKAEFLSLCNLASENYDRNFKNNCL